MHDAHLSMTLDQFCNALGLTLGGSVEEFKTREDNTLTTFWESVSIDGP